MLYHAVGSSPHRSSHAGRNVDAGMECAFTGKRILPVAEMAQQPAIHRPDGGHGVLLPSSWIGSGEAGEAGGFKEVVLVDGLPESGNQQTLVLEIGGAVHGFLQTKR